MKKMRTYDFMTLTRKSLEPVLNSCVSKSRSARKQPITIILEFAAPARSPQTVKHTPAPPKSKAASETTGSERHWQLHARDIFDCSKNFHITPCHRHIK